MADAFNLYPGSRIMFGDEEAAPLAFRQKVGPRQEIACDGLRVASAQAAPWNEVLVRGQHRK
jgi:hypothetical protein